MAKVSELKERARTLEQDGDFARAQAIYEHILKHLEGTPALKAEVPLYVKVGDLQLKQGEAAAAIESYERAAEIYARVGSAKSIAALAEKIRRADPTRDDAAVPLGRALLAEGHPVAAAAVIVRYAARVERVDVTAMLGDIEAQPADAARRLVEGALAALGSGAAPVRAEEPEPEAEPEPESEPMPEPASSREPPAAAEPARRERPSPLGQSMTDILTPREPAPAESLEADAPTDADEAPDAEEPDGFVVERAGAEAISPEAVDESAAPASGLPLLSFEDEMAAADEASQVADEAEVAAPADDEAQEDAEPDADVAAVDSDVVASAPEPESAPAAMARERADSLVEEAIAASLRADQERISQQSDRPVEPPAEGRPEEEAVPGRPLQHEPHVLMREPGRRRGPLIAAAVALVVVGGASGAWYFGLLPFGQGGDGGLTGLPTPLAAVAPDGQPEVAPDDSLADSASVLDTAAMTTDSVSVPADTTTFGPIGFNAVVDSGVADTAPADTTGLAGPVVPSDSAIAAALDTAGTPAPAPPPVLEPVVVPPGHAIAPEIVVIRGLPVLSVAETSGGLRVTQQDGGIDVVLLSTRADGGGAAATVRDIAVQGVGDTAVGTAAVGDYRVEARALMPADRLTALLGRLIRARPMN